MTPSCANSASNPRNSGRARILFRCRRRSTLAHNRSSSSQIRRSRPHHADERLRDALPLCFRKNYPYAEGKTDFSQEINAIAEDASIEEVLLSGGDPLSLSNRALEQLLQKLEAIPHVKRIRFHTRFPIGIPERIDTELLNIFAHARTQIFFVIHCNHPRELDEQIFSALRAVQRLGIPILTHTVLLRGVNDTIATLKQLLTLFIDHGILPYYINQLDRVFGTSHFEVPIEEGKRLMAELATQMPGYALPRYIQEVAGAASKVEITFAPAS